MAEDPQLNSLANAIAKANKRDTELTAAYGRVGLNTESQVDQVPQGAWTYMLNGNISDFSGNAISVQNDQSSVFYLQFPAGYVSVGSKSIPQINRVLYCLKNDKTGNSQIGYTDNNSGTYNILLDDSIYGSDLLNFDLSHPILKFEVKTTNCSTQVYWTDKFNNRRYLDFNNLPWKVTSSGTVLVGQIDANKLLVQPNFQVPDIKLNSVEIGGILIEGDYQFAVCYADILSNRLTRYYNVSNEVRIFNDHHLGLDFNQQTSKSIAITISNLDKSGLYDYFNLAAIKTINGITTVDYVGTFFIQNPTYNLTYTGEEQSNSNIKISMEEILEQYNYYDLAGDLAQVDDVLMWADLVKEDDIAYQKIWSQVNVGWGTWSVPYNKNEGYYNGINCANIQSYMRDEVYALEGIFILANGKTSSRFHIPGRVAIPSDLVMIPTSNKDIESTTEDTCITPIAQPTWKVYNTGYITSTDPGYEPGNTCYVGPYQYGKMSYWESENMYPSNTDIWGDLANKPIRHHKFPDSTITHIHDNNPYTPGTEQYISYQHNIYPIGFTVDVNSLIIAINDSSDLAPAQKNQIVGFKILRSSRTANKSVIAKGMLYNCGIYPQQYYNTATKVTTTTAAFLYPNYPFNDLNEDGFIAQSFVGDKVGTQTGLNQFQQGRFTFHSPDTSFFDPSGIQGSFLKLETAEFGSCKAHFVPVLKNAGEKLITPQVLGIAAIFGLLSSIGIQINGNQSTTLGEDTSGETFGVDGTAVIAPQNYIPAYSGTIDFLTKLIPYINYGWQYNAVGYYGNYTAVSNTGNKIRNIPYGGYITPGFNGAFGDTTTVYGVQVTTINNYERESSVYLSLGTDVTLPYSSSVCGITESSRLTAGQAEVCGSSTPFFKPITSYYGSIKDYLPGQYGQIFSYQVVDTGLVSNLYDQYGNTSVIPIIFGGDIFINQFALKRKLHFYNKSTVGVQDGTDIDYNQDGPSGTNTGNVGYPMWYYSTSNIVNIGDIAADASDLEDLFSSAGEIFTKFVLLGGLPFLFDFIKLIFDLFNDVLLKTFGIKITNLECNNYGVDNSLYMLGQAYLYAYGIPVFFVESEVNVDMRQAFNINEGNFYPNVGTDVPDNWLQETNTPIAFDNTYVYNQTFSKENKGTEFFATLRPDWTPDNPCYTVFNNRIIWSDPSSLEETKNNWLVYRPAAQKDLPKGFGPLLGIDRAENRNIVVRFTNKTQIYNALSTIQTSTLGASLGDPTLFSSPVLDLSETDSGFEGSQNKMFLKTPHGDIYVDAMRGQVILLTGTSTKELNKIMNDSWFANNLPFNILNYFPDVPTDNNYNGVGLHGVYDDLYERFILTKLDYTPLPGMNVSYDSTTNTYYVPISNNNGYNYYGNNTIQLTDPTYFCNRSWTISYSFKTGTWTSQHSFIPNYYIPIVNYFQSGYNIGTTPDLWNHNTTYTSFGNYRGEQYPYIIEYPVIFKDKDQILQSIQCYCEVRQYTNQFNFTEPDGIIFFNKCIVYNNQQNSGMRLLVPKSQNNLQFNYSYPQYNATSTSILVSKTDHVYNFNQIWDIVKTPNNNIWNNTECCIQFSDKKLNISNLNYGEQSFKKYPLRNKYTKIRLIKDDVSTYHLISKFLLTTTQTSYQ